MHIGFKGRIVDEPELRAGFIGCGSHSFRNLYPALQFAHVDLAAVCDLDLERAKAFADAFGASQAYADYREMLDSEQLDAVFICTGYDSAGRPLYPVMAVDCLRAGRHVWIEKPPAATCGDVETMQQAAEAAGRCVMVGMKKMFAPANQKARELMMAEDFGAPQLVSLTYPQRIPPADHMRRYLSGENLADVKMFLDHLCHPTSLLVYLLGMPETLYFDRSPTGAGMAVFRYASGTVAAITMSAGASVNGGMERTLIVGRKGRHITVENNTRLTLHRNGPLGYGDVPSFYTGTPEQASAVWEPEFSLGQLYNKGLFLLGYYNEIQEFVHCIIKKRTPLAGTLEQAWHITRIFEAFAEGDGRLIRLREDPPESRGSDTRAAIG